MLEFIIALTILHVMAILFIIVFKKLLKDIWELL